MIVTTQTRMVGGRLAAGIFLKDDCLSRSDRSLPARYVAKILAQRANHFPILTPQLLHRSSTLAEMLDREERILAVQNLRATYKRGTAPHSQQFVVPQNLQECEVLAADGN